MIGARVSTPSPILIECAPISHDSLVESNRRGRKRADGRATLEMPHADAVSDRGCNSDHPPSHTVTARQADHWNSGPIAAWGERVESDEVSVLLSA